MPSKPRRNPRDVVVSDVKRLRKEVRALQQQVANEARYNEKKFRELDRAIYELRQR